MSENKELVAEDKETDHPSKYDIFFYYYHVLNKLCDLKSVNDFFTKENVDPQYIFGYLYTVEIMIMKLMNELADFSRDWNIYTLIHWSDTDLSDPLIQRLKKENPILKYMYDLKELGTSISEYLYADELPNFSALEKDMDKISTLIKSINDYIVKELEVKNINEGTKEAQAMILTYVINTCFRPESHLQPVVPGHPQPEGSYKSTYFGNEKLIKRASPIFNGYKYTFAYILLEFKDIISGDFTEVISSIKKATSAYDIRHGGAEILRGLQERKFVRIFSMGQLVNITVERDIQAEKEGDLDFMFMKREIRVIRASQFLGWNSHFDLDDARFFFINTLQGMLVNPDAEVELLEITYTDNELPPDIGYSYAIYLLIGNSYANASYWIVFDRIALASTRDSYKTDSKYDIDDLIETYRDQIVLSKISVKRDLLASYFTSKDLSMMQLNTFNERLKSSNSMLMEFLAYLYTKTYYNAELVGLRVPYKETDIDALSKNEEYEFLCQAKSSLPITKDGFYFGLEQICKYFDGLKDRETDRKTKNIALVGTWSYAGDTYLHETDKAERKGVPLEELRKAIALNILEEKNIELVFYKDLRDLLLRDPRNSLLLKELDKIIEHID